MPEQPRPASERELQRQRQQVERQWRGGEITRDQADKLLEKLRSPSVVRE